MKKSLLTVVAIVLVAALAIGGTFAYLQDTDSDVNVMTVGNVEIEQIEQERVNDADGKHTLQSFTNNKALYPANYKDSSIPWAANADWVIAEDEAWKVVESGAGAMDKFVTVKNTGASEAYVRTIFAFETDKEDWVMHVITNAENVTDKTSWEWEWLGEVAIDGVNYTIAAATYKGALGAQETTIPSLKQVYMDKNAENEHAEIYGETYDILVLSQAVQTVNFNNAAQALDTAFGDVTTEKAVEWFTGMKESYFEDEWDGTVATAWYDENPNETEYVLETAEELAGLAELVDDGNTFAGKTITLSKDLDLAGIDFNPIGHSANGKAFEGTFDGQGHTISNLYQQSDLSAWQYEGEYYGLFAYTNGATIKNVTVADAYISSGRNEAAAIVGNAVDTTFSDITVSNTTLIAYNNSAGGVAAECYGDCSFTNITVDEDTVIGPLWGTYDVRLGGVVGMVQSGNNVSFSNITVSCKLDAINDVAANYQYWLYRYSGMLIGHVDGVNGVADPTGYVTCENVTVEYGDWVNYHYCEFESLGAGSYNAPGDYKYARVEPGTGTDGIDITACNHTAEESHNVLIVFDQLFGGGQGVKGLATYPGVTVVYP